jgi:hypothetical protein
MNESKSASRRVLAEDHEERTVPDFPPPAEDACIGHDDPTVRTIALPDLGHEGAIDDRTDVIRLGPAMD